MMLNNNFFKAFHKRYPSPFELLQLTLLYLYAISNLANGIANALGFCPEAILRLIPVEKLPLLNSVMSAFSSPEKSMGIHLLAVQIAIKQTLLSDLVKYNFILILFLEMIQNLAVSCWDILFNRDVYILNDIDILPEDIFINFLNGFFFIFLLIYLYCFINSILANFVSFPYPFKKITDSVDFWVKTERAKVERKKKEKKQHNKKNIFKNITHMALNIMKKIKTSVSKFIFNLKKKASNRFFYILLISMAIITIFMKKPENIKAQGAFRTALIKKIIREGGRILRNGELVFKPSHINAAIDIMYPMPEVINNVSTSSYGIVEYGPVALTIGCAFGATGLLACFYLNKK